MGLRWRAAAMALAALLGGCTTVPYGQEALYDLSEERAPPGAPAPHVFVLEKDGASIAVFGTTHLVPETLQWLSPATEAALKSADVIFTETSMFRADEVAISDEEAGLLAPRSLLPPGRTLWADAERRLGKARTARIKALLAQNDLDPGTYTAMRPWMVCRDLQIPPRLRRTVTAEDREMIAALNAAHGVPDLAPPDLKVELYGVSNGIETRFLESEYQRAYNFSRLDDAEALDCAGRLADRAAAPRSGKAIAAQYDELLTMWKTGDVERARAMAAREEAAISKEWTRLFLQGREQAWLEQLAAECAAPRRNCFVAVGMAHLGGVDGLLKGLEAMGYRRVTPQG